jgi:hypothetical protein
VFVNVEGQKMTVRLAHSRVRSILQCHAAVAAVGLGALLAAAPGADARSQHPSAHSVQVNVRAANRALHRFEHNVRGRRAVVYFTQLTGKSAAAANEAGALYRSAQSPAARRQAARALALVAGQQSAEAQGLASVLGSVPALLQAQVAQAISASTAGRSLVLGLLNRLLPQLPGSVQPQIASIIALNSVGGAQVPAQLAGVLSGGGVACVASAAVEQALAAASQALQTGLASVGPALALAPPLVQAQVQGMLARIPGLLTQVTQAVKQIIPCDTAAGGSPVGSGLPVNPTALVSGITQLVGGITGLVGQLLGGVLPTAGGGSTTPPTPPAAPGQLGGLLNGVSSLIPFGLGSLLHLVPGF